MQITRPDYYKEFSCIAGDCPDTCCAGWQIVIDENSLRKYRHVTGIFRNRLLNDIDWKTKTFRQYQHRCAFLNEDHLCDIYREAGRNLLCDTCKKYPRHIEEFEGLREISLSLSCPEAARILLSKKDKTHFFTIEKEIKEESYENFDYFLFTILMDTREDLFTIIQNREIPMSLRLAKLLACAHDLQLCLEKNELYQWQTLLARHRTSGYGNAFMINIQKRKNPTETPYSLLMQMWNTLIPEMEVLRPGWHKFLLEKLLPLYSNGCSAYSHYMERFSALNSGWEIQMEQLLVYWIFTYFCGAVYDEAIFSKVKMAVISTLLIRDLAAGSCVNTESALSFAELTSICYRFSRELEHSDQNLNRMEKLLSGKALFSFSNLLTLCENI